jgi:hypothetical protein
MSSSIPHGPCLTCLSREESTGTSTTAVFLCSAKSCFMPLSTRELVERAEVAACGTHLANDLAAG